ncbi:MAG: glycosyltransferase family 4 protein [Nannocystaceae bacterium]
MSIAYLVSCYPSISHTFIRREVSALRALGRVVHTFSQRRAPSTWKPNELDRIEQEQTHVLLPASPWSMIRHHIWALVRRPLAYARTFGLAMRARNPGLRNAAVALFGFIQCVSLARHLDKRVIRHLHAHFSNSGGNVALLATAYLGIRYSLTLHGSADFDQPSRFTLVHKIRAACLVVCVSQYGRSQAMRLCEPELWHKLHVVHCGIFLPSGSAHAAHGFPRPRPHRLRILTVGRLSPEKGHLGLIEAFARTRVETGLDLELHIVGEGPERSRLESTIAALKLIDRCVLLGQADEEGVRDAMRDADLFALSSLMEGIPVVLMEAMALGLPVVAPAVAGIPELVEHGTTGWTFPVGDWTKLSQKMAELLSDDTFRVRTTTRAREKVEAEFEIRRNATLLNAHFQRLTETQADPAGVE